MPFSEKIKKEALNKSSYRCCICRDLASDIHHIVSQAENGEDTLDNAAPLCASCHDLFVGNPEKRKKIRQMRDDWWELMELRKEYAVKIGNFDDLKFIEIDVKNRNRLRSNKGALYHCIQPHDNFEHAANVIFELVKYCQKTMPYQDRHLYLDIEGHRLDNDAFDHDMFELLKNFLLGFMLRFFTEIHTPLYSVINPKLQDNDIPEDLNLLIIPEIKTSANNALPPTAAKPNPQSQRRRRLRQC